MTWMDSSQFLFPNVEVKTGERADTRVDGSVIGLDEFAFFLRATLNQDLYRKAILESKFSSFYCVSLDFFEVKDM